MECLNNIVNKLISNKKAHFYYFIIILIAFLFLTKVCFPIFSAFDFYFHVERIDLLIKAFVNHEYPVYIDYETLNGYGYLTHAFYPNLTIVPFALIGIFTGHIYAYKILIYTTTFLCGIFTYKAVNRIFNNTFVASASAILYTFSYYKLLDTYSRAALGETLCFTFFPLVFWGLYEIIKGNPKKWYILAIGMSLIIFSHVTTTLIAAVTIFIILVLFIKPIFNQPKRVLYLIYAGIATCLITACFMLPLIEQMGSTTYYYEKIATLDINGDSLYTILQGMFGGIYPYVSNHEFVAGCGFVITITLFLRIFSSRKDEIVRKADYSLLAGAIILFIISSLYPWNTYPFEKLKMVLFSWRFYIVVCLLFAVSGSVYLYIFLKKRPKFIIGSLVFLSLLMCIMIVYSGKDYYKIFSLVNYNHQKATPENNYLLYGMEYIPANMPDPPGMFVWERGADSIGVRNSNTHIEEVHRERNVLKFRIDLQTPDTLELPLTYYKGYYASIDGEKLPVTESNHGLAQIPASKPGKVEVYYAGTPLMSISWYITIVSVIGLIIYIILCRKRNLNQDNDKL